jgi:hypothetical protein
MKAIRELVRPERTIGAELQWMRTLAAHAQRTQVITILETEHTTQIE